MQPITLSPTRRPRRQYAGGTAFTLIELILVMGVLATLVAIIMPSLASFFRGREIVHEGRRIVALTQFAHSQAVSTGVPQTLWLDPERNEYGLREEFGNLDQINSGRTYLIAPSIQLELDPSALSITGEFAIRFEPDGLIAEGSLTNLWLEQRERERMFIALSTNGFHYEIVGTERLQ